MSVSEYSIDLDAYLQRIAYAGSRVPNVENLHAITRHHTTAIPFENLDVLLGRGIDTEPAAVERKLVRDRRGGYCFEQNQLLLLALQALGYDAAPLSARVRWQRPPGIVPPRTHLFVRVTIGGEIWLTDAGVGGISLTSAIRLNSSDEQFTPHERRRIMREEGRFVHQVWLGRDWQDVCEFTGEEMPPIDRELANWWTSTNPHSKFRQNMMVARAGKEGTRFALNNREFTHRRGAEIIEERVLETAEELLELLAERFSLHFPAGTRFGPPGSPWPS